MTTRVDGTHRHSRTALSDREIWRDLLRQTSDAVALSAGDSRRIVDIGTAFCALAGYPPSALLGMTLDDLGLDTGTAVGRSGGDGAPARATLRRKDGGLRAVQVTHTPVLDGRLLVTVVRDGGDAARPDPAAIVAGIGEAILAVGNDGIITEYNVAAEPLFGVPREVALGTPFTALFDSEHLHAVNRVLCRALDSPAAPQRALVRVGHSAQRDVELTVSRIRTGNSPHPSIVVVARAHTAHGPIEEDLRHRADHDPLTGVYNRRRFRDELDRELARARRQRTAGAVLALDLDHFKDVNDTLGHGRGDAVLVEVAASLRRRLRVTDVLGRLGGDEFSVLLPGTSATRAQHVAMKLIQSLEAITVELPGVARPVTVSIGIAPYLAGDGATAADLLARADVALYQAKDAGRHCSRVFLGEESPTARASARVPWEQRIRRALEGDDRLVLHEQPLLALRDGLPQRAELLLRMRGDDSPDLIPPAAFLHVAERTHLIRDVDRWVLRRAAALVAEAERTGRRVRLAVNVSTSTIADQQFPNDVAQQLAAAGVDGHELCFEINEAAAIVNLERARAFALAVTELGCEIALDDFGASFASFHYLKHLPIDLVKIDGRFIAALPGSTTDRMIVQAIVTIATGLGKRTVAEWVSDHETVELLRAYGVDYAQGHHISSPRPAGRPPVPC